MRAALSALTFSLSLHAAPAVAQPARGLEQKDEFAKRYRMGDESDERARVGKARAHPLTFATPEQAFLSWQASIVRSSKPDYLECLHPDFRAKEYPKGAEHYIKNVDYVKYWYLAMYATYEGSDVKGDAAELKVVFSLRGADGTVQQQHARYELRRDKGRWLFASR